MTDDVDVLHHLGLITRDMAATVAQYERLGFAFTPLSLPHVPLTPGGPPEPLGVANRCAVFAHTYLEMLGVVDAARWAAITRAQRGPFDIDPALARYEGLHVLHLGSDDLERTRARLLARGLQPSPIRPFQRMVDTTDGPRMMRARSLSFPPGSDPEALLQIAQHDTPELVFQPRHMDHPNGATAITGVIVCVADPDRVAAKYEAYSGHPARNTATGLVVDLGRSRITVVGPDRLESVLPGEVPPTIPFLSGVTFRADLGRAAEILRRHAIHFETVDGRMMVRARDACGAAILFEHQEPS